MTTFINGCGCKITIDKDIDSVEELEGNAKHLVSMSGDWRCRSCHTKIHL